MSGAPLVVCLKSNHTCFWYWSTEGGPALTFQKLGPFHMTGYISRTMKNNHKLFLTVKIWYLSLLLRQKNKNLGVYFSVFEWSENETHASEIHEYLLTQQTKSLGSLNLSCSCFSHIIYKYKVILQCQSGDIW